MFGDSAETQLSQDSADSLDIDAPTLEEDGKGATFDKLKHARGVPSLKSNKRKKKAATTSKKRKASSKDDDDDDSSSKKSKKDDANEEDKEKKKRRATIARNKKIIQREREELELRCLKKLREYEDDSVCLAIDEFSSTDLMGSDNNKKKLKDGFSVHLPKNISEKYFARSGIEGSSTDAKQLATKIAEQYIVAVTTKMLPFMNARGKKTISSGDVHLAQLSEGHVIV